ncbi:hypothetical protein [Desulfitobacterium chlororespirans]|uniref:Uncharacterized protein n=1 Tax=Desulfitobacterium chlororespirans DSM 11544 TaxID=1121395 RepID=A0A1M7UY46_9FIRM|nr:hypothetical protein [Desulfitobacterium chlororespirans]SHN87961.1 hypothetical protein SAMN02745215_05053 [Desulfitobacterium chlororespirans DSM 11544]
MMERLTERDGKNWAFIACRDCTKPHCTECEEFRKQAATLAAYENLQLPDHSKEKLIELLIQIVEPVEKELEELKDCVELFGTEIFNNLDYVDLPVKQLNKLNALRMLIIWQWEDV